MPTGERRDLEGPSTARCEMPDEHPPAQRDDTAHASLRVSPAVRSSLSISCKWHVVAHGATEEGMRDMNVLLADLPAGPALPWWFAGVSDWATAGLVVLGLAAIVPILQNRRSREIDILMEIGRRWDSPEMMTSRSLVDRLSQDDTLIDAVCSDDRRGGEEYHELMREPGYLEDLGVIYYSRGIRPSSLIASMGYLVPERWAVWKDALERLGEVREKPQHFSFFREMAAEMDGGDSHRAHRKRAKDAMRIQS